MPVKIPLFSSFCIFLTTLSFYGMITRSYLAPKEIKRDILEFFSRIENAEKNILLTCFEPEGIHHQFENAIEMIFK